MADVETNGTMVRMDLVDSATVHFDISSGIYTCECSFSEHTWSPDHKVMVSIKNYRTYMELVVRTQDGSDFCLLNTTKKVQRL